jgi:hypothetical protein
VNLDLFTGDDCLRKYNGERSEELKQSKNSLQMARGSAGLSLTATEVRSMIQVLYLEIK